MKEIDGRGSSAGNKENLHPMELVEFHEDNGDVEDE